MSTITKEFTKKQLIEQAKSSIERYTKAVAGFPRHLNVAMDLELARIALASLEAEADYIRFDCGCCGWETIEDWRENDVCPKCNHHPMGKTELFTAPPAPESVPDEIEPTVEAIKRVLPTSNPDEYAACIGADMWNACRAAMLKGSPV